MLKEQTSLKALMKYHPLRGWIFIVAVAVTKFILKNYIIIVKEDMLRTVAHPPDNYFNSAG